MTMKPVKHETLTMADAYHILCDHCKQPVDTEDARELDAQVTAHSIVCGPCIRRASSTNEPEPAPDFEVEANVRITW